jgi:hypothetical protein
MEHMYYLIPDQQSPLTNLQLHFFFSLSSSTKPELAWPTTGIAEPQKSYKGLPVSNLTFPKGKSPGWLLIATIFL